MNTSAAPAPSPRPRSFAGVLMDVAASGGKRPPARDLDGLEDDVATLSYEQAIQSHGRYRPTGMDPLAAAPGPAKEPAAGPRAVERAVATRCSSVTIRLSAQERECLQKRAAEAGVSISDYLRSSLFELESLRGQVREAVAALRALQAQKRPRQVASWLRWMAPRESQRAAN